MIKVRCETCSNTLTIVSMSDDLIVVKGCFQCMSDNIKVGRNMAAKEQAAAKKEIPKKT